MAKLLFLEIYRLHDLPLSIALDWGTCFLRYFLAELVSNGQHSVFSIANNSSGDEIGTDSRANHFQPGEDDGDEITLVFIVKWDRKCG